MASDWKETAWNGIRFVNPSDWEPAEIGKRYLMLEDDAGPALEIKWEPIKGIFSHQKHLRRLSSLYKRQSGKKLQESALPMGWEDALEAYETSGFTWSGETVSGNGVILFCSQCKNATLIQFYENETEKISHVSRKILASLKDHPKNGWIVWAMFDIRAVIPEEFRLVRHRFTPGEFHISFAAGRRRIALHRWGPATVLLSGINLEQFARNMTSLPDKDPISVGVEDRHMLEWEAAPQCSSGGARWWRRIKRRPTLLRFRIWHEAEKNRILGIRMEGVAPPDPQILEKITASYESI
jgi:hypothetical protein